MSDDRRPFADDDEEEAPPARPGLSTFTIEGRAAPALFVFGWLFTLLGLGCLIAAIVGGDAPVLLVLGLLLLAIGLIAAAGSQGLDRRLRGTDHYAGPSPVLVFAATVPVAFLAAVVVGAALVAADQPRDGPAARLLLVAAQGVVTVGLVGLLVVGVGALTWREMGLHGRARAALAELAWGAAWALPVIAVTMVVAAILVTVFRVAPDAPLPPTGEPVGLALNLVAGAVIAPIAEEIFFRGVATTAWVRRYGARPGIIRGAVFFALAHVLLLGGTTLGEAVAVAVVGFCGRLPVAIALGWIYLSRGSLWASIGLHAAFNAVLLILAHVAIASGAG